MISGNTASELLNYIPQTCYYGEHHADLVSFLLLFKPWRTRTWACALGEKFLCGLQREGRTISCGEQQASRAFPSSAATRQCITSLHALSVPLRLACFPCTGPNMSLKPRCPLAGRVHVSKRRLSDHGRWFAVLLLTCKWVRTSPASLPDSCWRRNAGSGPSAVPGWGKALALLFSWLALSLRLGRGGLG